MIDFSEKSRGRSCMQPFNLPYLLVYKSTPHFPGQNSDFSSFMVKEIKFRPIEMSQNVNLLFLRMY